MLEARQLKSGGIGNYLTLAKSRAILPHVMTAAAAMFLAVGGLPSLKILLFTIVGGACVAASANTFNSYLDRDIDLLMGRTRHRPLPSGQLKPNHALVFGISLGLAGIYILIWFVNWITAVLALITLLYYVFPYTLWLKRRTYWSTVIGSGIGALSPLIGWSAVSSSIKPTPFLLSGILIFWTIPHFWTLAIFRHDDYEKVGLRVLPIKGAMTWIIACSLSLVAVSLLLVSVAGLGYLYIAIALFLNIGLIYLLVHMIQDKSLTGTHQLYRYSIFYIAFLFGAMIVDRLVFV
jgi:heme o synthase